MDNVPNCRLSIKVRYLITLTNYVLTLHQGKCCQFSIKHDKSIISVHVGISLLLVGQIYN